MFNTVTPLAGYIVIKEQEAETKTPDGVYLPDSAQEKPQIGKVIEVGEPVPASNFRGEYPSPVKKDELVVFKKYTGHPIKIKGEEYQFVGFENLIGTVK